MGFLVGVQVKPLNAKYLQQEIWETKKSVLLYRC